MPQPSLLITTSPSWFTASQSARMRPASGRLFEAREAVIVRLKLSVSPGRTGFIQRMLSRP